MREVVRGAFIRPDGTSYNSMRRSIHWQDFLHENINFTLGRLDQSPRIDWPRNFIDTLQQITTLS